LDIVQLDGPPEMSPVTPYEAGSLGRWGHLCGCFVTDVLDWRRISALEGDECKKCAEIAFDASTGGGKPLSRNAKSAGR